MSNLPEIDSIKVIQKFSETLADVQYQLIQYKVLTETLREQKESVIRDRYVAHQKIEELTERLSRYEDTVPDIVESTVEEN